MAKKGKNEPRGQHAEEKPKIIIKKVKGHGGGHHGGAWKVAYADFVTAMMALFLVLWILGASDKKFKAGLAHYFRNPGVFDSTKGIIPDGGEDRLGAGVIASPSSALEALRTQLEEGLQALKEYGAIKGQVTMEITPEGLLIELVDKDQQAFFDLSSASLNPAMRKVLEVVVKELKSSPHKISISGHTDARPFQNETYYSNWDLSSARALNTRRAMEELGLARDKIARVVGYADRQPRVADPLDSSNRRISILVMRPEPKEQKNSP
jgi:chemotaxis protein MotB